MGIRTELSTEELELAASSWALGKLKGSRGIPEGSVNTLYLLETKRGKFVLRLSEGRSFPEVDFETRLLQFLHGADFSSVRLVAQPGGKVLDTIKERYACVFHWAPGESGKAAPFTPERARESGKALARLHRLTRAFPHTLPNRYAPKVVGTWVAELVEESKRTDRAEDEELWAAIPMLKAEAEQALVLPSSLEGIIHADWFLDNLHFVGDDLSAVLDFEMACKGPYVLDLAVAIHASCWGENDFNLPQLKALMEGYLDQRQLDSSEWEAFFAWAKFAALRFTVSRIRDFHRSELSDNELKKKDWRRFRDRLSYLRDLGPQAWLELVRG